MPRLQDSPSLLFIINRHGHDRAQYRATHLGSVYCAS